MRRRQSGIVVPLFSLVSNKGWGIGEFGDLPMFARWLKEAGQSLVQILPIHEMPPIETSPYSAMTAMALDPIYISMSSVADFSGLGAEHALDGAEQAEIRRLRQLPRAICVYRSKPMRSVRYRLPCAIYCPKRVRTAMTMATPAPNRGGKMSQSARHRAAAMA